MNKNDLISRFVAAQFLEACRCLEEGVASARDIDLSMRAGAGLRVGPLAAADAMGLDTLLASLQQLADRVGPRFAPPETLQRLVSANQLGVKTGRGFHEYSGETQS